MTSWLFSGVTRTSRLKIRMTSRYIITRGCLRVPF